MPSDEPTDRVVGIARLIAIVAGIAGVVLCALVPLLPVKQTTATVLWPQGTDAAGNVTAVTAPLVSGAPQSLDVSIPCSAIATLPAEGGLVFSTIPPGGIAAGRTEAEVASALGDPVRLARELKAEAGIQRWHQEKNPSAAAGAAPGRLCRAKLLALGLLVTPVPAVCSRSLRSCASI